MALHGLAEADLPVVIEADGTITREPRSSRWPRAGG